MRDASEVNEPLRVVLKEDAHDSGPAYVVVKAIDGGGQEIGPDSPGYEVACVSLDDEGIITILQRNIERVEVAATGEEVEFGNPYMEGHPRPKELFRRLR